LFRKLTGKMSGSKGRSIRYNFFSGMPLHQQINRLFIPLSIALVVLYSAAFYKTLRVTEDLVVERYLQRLASEFKNGGKTPNSKIKQQYKGAKIYFQYENLPGFIRKTYHEPKDGFFEFDHEGTDQVMLVTVENDSWQFIIEDSTALELAEESELKITLLFIVPSGIVFLLSLFLIHRTAHRLSSPLTSVTDEIEQSDGILPLDFEPPSASPEELHKLIKALQKMNQRVGQHIQREQQFTGFVSHELRTPLSVIKSAHSLLASRDSNPKTQSYHETLGQAISDMEALIDTFLMLGREKGSRTFRTQQLDEAWLLRILKRFLHLVDIRDLDVSVQVTKPVEVEATKNILDVLLNNLIKNAITHSGDGALAITLTNRSLTIRNSLPQKNATQRPDSESLETRQHGLGLLIVKEICSRFAWQFNLSKQDEEMVVCIQF